MKILLFILMLTSMVFAHKLYVLADDNGTSLHVKSYFTKVLHVKIVKSIYIRIKKLLIVEKLMLMER